MRSGYALLLESGHLTPIHKTRELADARSYRSSWTCKECRLVAIVHIREKPDWLRRMWGIPVDGQWHPHQPEDGLWQGVRIVRDEVRTTYEYDIIERVGYDQREHAANRFKTRRACELRCTSLNNGWTEIGPDYSPPVEWRTMRNFNAGDML